MANQFYVQPLGGFNAGDALQGLMDQQKQNQQEELQREELNQMRDLSMSAAKGDVAAIDKLWGLNPKFAQIFEQRESEKVAKLGATQALEAKKAETDWGIRWKQAGTPEKKQALMQEALDNPLIDIDEDDVGIEGPQADLAVNAMLYGHLGKDGYKQLIANDKNQNLTPEERTFNALTSGMSPEDVTKAKRIRLKLDQGAGTAKGSISTSEKKINLPGMRSSMTMTTALNILDKAKESQSKNGGFALNMNRGLDKLKELDAKGFDPKDISFVQTFLAGKSLGNYIMSSDEQLYAGAIESMINSIARRESGAAIGEEETQRFFARYMPQSGDSKARIKQKRASLEGQFRSIRGQSGRVYDALRLTMNEEDQSDQPEIFQDLTQETIAKEKAVNWADL